MKPSKLYTEEEVISLLEKQREITATSLGFSSAVYIYPMDYEKIKKVLMLSPIVKL